MIPAARRPALGPRVRGIRVRALPKDKLVALAYSGTLEEFLNVLRTTPYAASLERAPESIGDLRRALVRTYLDRIRGLYAGLSGKAKDVASASLSYFEYDNIRNVATAIRAGKNPEEFVLWEPMDFTRRRYVVMQLLGAKSIEELAERLRGMGHRAYKAFELAAKYGMEKLSFFLDRQWVEELLSSSREVGDRSFREFTHDVVEYFDSLIALRARLWGLGEELQELVVGKPTDVVLSAVRDPPAKFLEVAQAATWGKLLLELVAGEPTLEKLAVAMDNMYPAYMLNLANIYTIRYTEFSLGALAAHLEYLRAEVVLLIRAASMIVEGVPQEKRREVFEPLVLS